MRKHRFRKVYFICEDNRVFADNYAMINCYKEENYAKSVCVSQQRLKMENAKMLWAKEEKVPTLTAHGFYLVHESLFDEILKEHSL